MTLLNEIDYMISQNAEIKAQLEKELKNSPEGNLECKKEKASLRYYCIFSSNGKRKEKYLGKKDTEIIKALEYKHYYSKMLKTVISREHKLLSIRNNLKTLPDSDCVFLEIPKEKRHLIEPFVIEKPAENLKLRYKKRTVDSMFITQNGEKVRSKSELIIADRLKSYGITYYYETPIRMFDQETGTPYLCYPDFLVMNSRTGKKYYWEHLGMLDNPEYVSKCLKKLENYAEIGLFLGENIILTAESSLYGLSTEYVDTLIKLYLK